MTNRDAITDKQISYILMLIKGKNEADAFSEIAKDMGASVSAARRRATKWDAAATISRLKGNSDT